MPAVQYRQQNWAAAHMQLKLGRKCVIPVQVRLRTENAEYVCSRAAPLYRAKFQHLQEQAAVLHEVRYPCSMLYS